MNWHVKRAGQALVTLWAVATISFIMVRALPYNAVDIVMAGYTSQIDREIVRAEVEQRMMIDPDAPMHEAYWQYMTSLAQGDLGESTSVITGMPVSELIADALPWTLFVMGLATFGLFAISLSLGAIMAYREQSYFDYSNTAVGIMTTSVPYYVAAILLIKYVGFSDLPVLDALPPFNRRPDGAVAGFNWEFLWGAFRHAVLPALSFILTAYGAMALAMRGNSIQVLGEDYVRVAELRGLPSRRIALRYVGRNAVLPLYTSLLISVGAMLGAGVILETIFSYEGIGYWMLRAIEEDDMPIMMGTFLVITVTLVFALWIADLTYGRLDPRIKTGDEGEAY